ncbi:MAG TPA: hypothetical protein VGM42_11295 [Rhodopila sp.]
MAPITVTLTEDTWAAIQADAAAIANAGTVANIGTVTNTNTITNTGTTSGNVYPLTMPAGIAAAAPVTLGTGPNSIVIAAANNPGSSLQNQFVVILYQGTTETGIAGPLTVTSDVGASVAGSQVFTLNGTFEGVTAIELVANGNGLSGIWIESLSVDLIPWFVDQDAINSRGTGSPNYQSGIAFNSNGAHLTYLPPNLVPAAPIPVPAATASVISGATINETGAVAAPLATLLTDTPAAGTLVLPAGTFVGSGGIPNAGAITGAGIGKTVITTADFPVYQNKGVLVPNVAGVTISNMTISGAQIAASLGNNAAGIRDNGAGIGFTATNVEITECQDGVLTFPSNVTMTGCSTHGNGAGDGFTHELYFGGDTTNTVTLTNHASACGAGATHALKSRAGTTTVSGGSFTGSSDTTGNIGGSVVDIPDAGVFSMSGATLIVSKGAANTLFFGYGMESALNAAVGLTATFTNCVFTDNSGSGGQIQAGPSNPTAELVLTGCAYTGSVAPQISGFAKVTGTITKAAA